MKTPNQSERIATKLTTAIGHAYTGLQYAGKAASLHRNNLKREALQHLDSFVNSIRQAWSDAEDARHMLDQAIVPSKSRRIAAAKKLEAKK